MIYEGKVHNFSRTLILSKLNNFIDETEAFSKYVLNEVENVLPNQLVYQHTELQYHSIQLIYRCSS